MKTENGTQQNEMLRLVKRLQHIPGNEGLGFLLRRGFDKLTVYGQYPMRQRQFQNRTFPFSGAELPYFIHHYNATWRNERCIEIALANHFMTQWAPQTMLELGNVMSYYSPHQHVVVDKYEPSPGIRNEDFLDFHTDERFEAFLSISTFEHIGWDEPKKDSDKLKACFNKISQHVTDPSQVLVTTPLGYNDFLDSFIRNGELPFQQNHALVRESLDQRWRETSIEEALQPSYRYGQRYDGANALFVGLGVTH